MKDLDKLVGPAEAEGLIQKQIDDLKMKLVIIDEMKPVQLQSGDSVSITGVLFKSVTFDIVKQSDGLSVNGCLPHYQSKTSKKNIFLMARIYQIGKSWSQLYFSWKIANFDCI